MGIGNAIVIVFGMLLGHSLVFKIIDTVKEVKLAKYKVSNSKKDK